MHDGKRYLGGHPTCTLAVTWHGHTSMAILNMAQNGRGVTQDQGKSLHTPDETCKVLTRHGLCTHYLWHCLTRNCWGVFFTGRDYVIRGLTSHKTPNNEPSLDLCWDYAWLLWARYWKAKKYSLLYFPLMVGLLVGLLVAPSPGPSLGPSPGPSPGPSRAQAVPKLGPKNPKIKNSQNQNPCRPKCRQCLD